MLRIDKQNNIYLTRGDTATLSLSIIDNENLPYRLQAGDKVTLTVKRANTDEQAIFQKAFSVPLEIDTVEINIDIGDTQNLEYGVYYYDVQVNTANGKVFTVITPHIFEVAEEVTW